MMRRASYYQTDNFQPCSSAGYRIKRLHKTAYQLIEHRFRDLDLSFSQWIALVLLHDELVDTCAALADFQGHDRGATTRLLDGLEDRGLISRARDADDRRIVRLMLTKAGAAACKQSTPRVMEFWNEVLDKFDQSEVDRFHVMLDAIQHRINLMTQSEMSS